MARYTPPPANDSLGEENNAPEWGVAGASAQRQFDKQEGRRRARLRVRGLAVVVLSVLGALGGAVLATVLQVQATLFVVLGAVVPVLKLMATPQHIDAWRSGAAGERIVGARLDKLRPAGVLTLHDRRVPGRRTNIDHIAVSPSGVYVIDTKNVAGKVSLTGTVYAWPDDVATKWLPAFRHRSQSFKTPSTTSPCHPMSFVGSCASPALNCLGASPTPPRGSRCGIPEASRARCVSPDR